MNIYELGVLFWSVNVVAFTAAAVVFSRRLKRLNHDVLLLATLWPVTLPVYGVLFAIERIARRPRLPRATARRKGS